MLKKFEIVFVVFLFIFLIYSEADAGGLDNSTIGIKGYAMGKAFTGLADDASAVYYNPAGIVFNDYELDMEISGLFYFTDMNYEASGTNNNSDETIIIPSVFGTVKIGDFGFGLGFYVPYGGGQVNYENFMSSGTELEAGIAVYAITGSFAYKLTDEFSIGAGASALIGNFRQKMFSSGLSAYIEQELSGISGFMANVGAMYRIGMLSLGINIRSSSMISIDGETEIGSTTTDTTAEFELPFYVNLGAALMPVEGLTLAMDLSFQFWASTDNIKLITGSTTTNNKTHYVDNMYVSFGGEYAILQIFKVRCGVNYVLNATADEGLAPTSNDVDQLILAVGIAYEILNFIDINASAHYAIGFEREYLTQTFDKDALVIQFGIKILFDVVSKPEPATK